jgi:SAM-dependent methyltransferase
MSSFKLLLLGVLCFVSASWNFPCLGQDARPRDRTSALREICEKLGVGPSAVIADIGCGGGSDSMVFASIVGPKGTVLSEEIEVNRLKDVLKRSGDQSFPQVVPILGQSEDPRLPNGFVDLEYMHLVFHHFSEPRAMLRNLWLDLKPGGHLAIVDQSKGPPKDLSAPASREKEHHWTSETAVVRMAREEGFLFVDAMDDSWHEKDPFVMVFRRPPDGAEPRGDPDLPLPFDAKALLAALSLPPKVEGDIVLFALDGGRDVLPALREVLGGSARIHDVVLEEWVTAKDELPPGSEAGAPRTAKGDLTLPGEAPLSLVLFADAYHRLWDPSLILERLKARMGREGRLAILDRRGPDGESRRLAGHRRRLAPSLARREVERAGFELAAEPAPPASDRFLMVFRPVPDSERFALRETDEAFELTTKTLAARVRKKGYVSGVEAGMLDVETGAREMGFGLHIMDFLMAPGWREDGYEREAKIHGNLPKHLEEGPQICTQAGELPVEAVRGPNFVAFKMSYTFQKGYEGHGAGSRWEQTIVFPAGKRYFFSSEEITCANSVKELFYRIDMPGHARLDGPSGPCQAYLSYHGKIAEGDLAQDFGPDEKFLYQRTGGSAPERFIRAYRTRGAGGPGPWVAGMTLDPSLVKEAWCHRRGYLCFIQELWGRDVDPGERIGAAYIVGFFDTVEEMESVYDKYRGAAKIVLSPDRFDLKPREPKKEREF